MGVIVRVSVAERRSDVLASLCRRPSPDPIGKRRLANPMQPIRFLWPHLGVGFDPIVDEKYYVVLTIVRHWIVESRLVQDLDREAE